MNRRRSIRGLLGSGIRPWKILQQERWQDMDDVELVNSGCYRQKGDNIRDVDVREKRERERELWTLQAMASFTVKRTSPGILSRPRRIASARKGYWLTLQVYAGLRTALWISRASIALIPFTRLPFDSTAGVLSPSSIPLRCKWALSSFDD